MIHILVHGGRRKQIEFLTYGYLFIHKGFFFFWSFFGWYSIDIFLLNNDDESRIISVNYENNEIIGREKLYNIYVQKVTMFFVKIISPSTFIWKLYIYTYTTSTISWIYYFRKYSINVSFSYCILETYCQNIFFILNSIEDCQIDKSNWVNNIRHYFSFKLSWSCIPRETNCMEHALFKHTLIFTSQQVWLQNDPSWLLNLLLRDVDNATILPV